MLVVDDEPDIRQLVKINLQLDGHDVRLADDGALALASIEEQRPDLLLLDVMMPNVDGWGVLEAVKSHVDPLVRSIPVLMLTANVTVDARARGGIEGAIRYLAKPFAPQELRDEVAAALDGEPEIDKRRRVQRATLEQLARAQKGGDQTPSAATRPHLTRYERRVDAPAADPRLDVARSRVPDLTDNQRRMLVALAASTSVTEAASGLGVSRSNVYASLRRVSRRLGITSVTELLALLRRGELDVAEVAEVAPPG